MKKKIAALLISAAMVSGSLTLPVYAAEESSVEFAADETEVSTEPETAEEQQEEVNVSEEADDSDEGIVTEDFFDQFEAEDFSDENEAAGTGTVFGGNINWGSSDSFLPTDKTAAGTGNVLLGIKGSYIADAQNALDRINEIRKEACEEGIRDPRDESRNLTPSDYVPIKWSSDMEYIARIRAAEASVGTTVAGHTRLNGSTCWTAKSPNGFGSWGEVLAWNGSRKFLPGIEQWYEEKKDWTEKTGGVTGHYTEMIDPDNIYVGLATFVSSDTKYSTTTAGEYASRSGVNYATGQSGAALDESYGPAINNCIQTVEVKAGKVTAVMADFESLLAAKDSVQADFKVTAYGRRMQLTDQVNWKSSNEKAATVDSTGKVTGVHQGSADITASWGDFTVTKTIEVTGHAVVTDPGVEATCETEGKTEGSHCSICNEILKEQKTIPATGHAWDEGTVTQEATCEETGVKTYTCKNCGKTKIEGIKATGHTVVTDPKVKVTCETEGKTEGSHCSVCGKILKEQKTIPATGHAWDEGTVTKEATCEEAGVKTYTCSNCGQTKTEEIKATGHTVVTDPEVKATCEAAGKTEGSHCSVCDKVFKEQQTIPATGHAWDEGTVTQEATCEETGVKTYTCSNCGQTKTEEIKATGHIWDEGTVTQEATCEEVGIKTYTCEKCGATRTEPISVVDHKYGSWKTISKANVFSSEKQARTCTVCGTMQQRNVGSKLQKTMKVNISSMPLKIGQKTTVLKVTGLARGDSIVSWKSSNTKIVKVSGKINGTCTVTAGSKTGKAKITISLKSGLQKTVTVSVQKSTVRTEKISGIARTLTLQRKQKITLQPGVQPLTSAEKITYSSSNSAVVTVSSKGQITAKKKGTAVITVRSGSKTVKCKVIVK